MFPHFIDASTRALPNNLKMLLLESSSLHAAQRLRLSEQIRPLSLPSYCPVLNPIVRV
jgi:hypothetical protein